MSLFRQISNTLFSFLASFLALFYAAWKGVVLIVTAPYHADSFSSSKKVTQIWLRKSAHLLRLSIAYNLISIFVVRPLLIHFFPALSVWEKTKGLFGGSTRLTYEEIFPFVAPLVWVLGNGLLIALLSKKYQEAQEATQPEIERSS